jgi:hypothetical protein
MESVMPTSRARTRTLHLAAYLLSFGSAACASGGTVGEASSTSSGPGAGGSDGRGGGGGDDDDDDDGKSSAKSSGSNGDGGGTGDGGATSSDGGGGNGGDGGNGDGGDAASSTGTTTGTGDPCAIDSDCFDSNPCTVETCGGVSGCVQTQVVTGQTGTTTEGSICDGVCQTDGACGLSLYERMFAPGQAFTRQALSQAWTGADAPPPRGIAAVELIYERDALYVFTDAGRTHARLDGIWQEPGDTTDVFPGVDAAQIDCVMSWQPQAAGNAIMQFHTSGITRSVWTYSIGADYDVVLVSGPTEQTGGGGSEPPYGQFDCDVSFAHQYGFAGAQPWLDLWEGYNGSLWQFDGTLGTWVARGAQADSPLWGAMPNGPAPGTTRDVYLDGTILGFVAP